MTDRFEKGWQKLTEIHGDRQRGERVLDAFREVAPDLPKFVVEFGYGDVYSRPGLDLKSRQLATVAALAALGKYPNELAVHIHGALNVGWTKEEIVEVIMQMALYAGFPAALNAAHVASEVFAEREREAESSQ